MRDIKIYVDDLKTTISNKLIGFAGEHLATQLSAIFDLPDTAYKYRYVFKSNNIQMQTELLDEPIFVLPQKVVENDGLIIIQIIVYLDDVIIKTAQVEAFIGKALSVAESVEDRNRGLVGATGNNIEMYQGTTQDIFLIIYDNENNIYKLSGADTLIFAFGDLQKGFNSSCQNADGICTLHLDISDTLDIVGIYVYNIFIRTPDIFNVICEGEITIKRVVAVL